MEADVFALNWRGWWLEVADNYLGPKVDQKVSSSQANSRRATFLKLSAAFVSILGFFTCHDDHLALQPREVLVLDIDVCHNLLRAVRTR